MILGNVRHLLLQRLIAQLSTTSRIALCGGGRYLEAIWPELRSALAGRNIVAVLDDGLARQGRPSVLNLAVRPVEWVGSATADAILITSEHHESVFWHRLAGPRDEGVVILRTAHAEQNEAVTPEMVASLLDDPRLDLFARATPWNEPLPRTPLWAGLEITTGCNLNCVMCETHSSRRPTGEMSLDQFDRALDELEANGIRHLTLHTIGEPTIHRRFRDILRISHQRGFGVWLSTNGQLMDRFMDALAQWPVMIIRWSIDGASRETYERIRVGGKFGRLLTNMRRMRELIDQRRLPTRMEMNVTLSAENLHETAAFFDVFGPLLDDDQIHFSIVNSLSAGDGSYYESTRLLENPRQVPCVPLWQSLYVGFDGQVSACCRDYHGELIVGDLATSTLEDIWNGPALGALRARHAANDVAALPHACQNCFCAENGQTELLAALIAAVQRQKPRPSPAEFTARIREFLLQLRCHVPAADVSPANRASGRPLPVLVSP